MPPSELGRLAKAMQEIVMAPLLGAAAGGAPSNATFDSFASGPVNC
jgi:hypothetical protein